MLHQNIFFINVIKTNKCCFNKTRFTTFQVLIFLSAHSNVHSYLFIDVSSVKEANLCKYKRAGRRYFKFRRGRAGRILRSETGKNSVNIRGPSESRKFCKWVMHNLEN